MSLVAITTMLKNSITFLAAKRTALLEHRNDIDTIAVGSSHGDCCFNPAFFPGAFNLCSSSQDLKYSSYLYEKTCELCPNIKNLVIFYSIFSPSSELEKTPNENQHCLALNEIFKLGVKFENKTELLQYLHDSIQGKLDNATVQNGYFGFMPTTGKGFFPESENGAQSRANDHMKRNKGNASHLYLVRMLLKAKAMKHRTFIVLTPTRSDYKQASGADSSYLFRALYDLLENFQLDYQPEIINFFDSDLFNDTHFADFDHLSPTGEGTRILSTKLKELISG